MFSSITNYTTRDKTRIAKPCERSRCGLKRNASVGKTKCNLSFIRTRPFIFTVRSSLLSTTTTFVLSRSAARVLICTSAAVFVAACRSLMFEFKCKNSPRRLYTPSPVRTSRVCLRVRSKSIRSSGLYTSSFGIFMLHPEATVSSVLCYYYTCPLSFVTCKPYVHRDTRISYICTRVECIVLFIIIIIIIIF